MFECGTCGAPSGRAHQLGCGQYVGAPHAKEERKSMAEIHIENAGPIRAVDIPIPDSGGLVILKGRNGSGKSHALAASQSLLDPSKRPAVRDGARAAQVEGLGARITVGRKTTRAGELEVSHLEGEDPSLLIDPGLKDEKAADLHRLRALLRLARAKVDRPAFAALVGGEDELRRLTREATWTETDLVAVVAAVKRDIESHARKAEDEAAQLQTLIIGKQDTLRDLGDAPGALPLEEAQKQHERAVEEEAEARGRHEATIAAQAAGREAEASLAALGDYAGTEQAIEDAQRGRLEAQEAVTALERNLEAARYKLQIAEAAVGEHEKAKRQRDPLVRAIAAAAEAKEVSAGTRCALAARVTETRKAVEAATIADRMASVRADLDRLRAEEVIATRTAEKLREAAAGTETLLTDAVAAIAGSGLRIEDGRLMVEHPERGWVPFGELSHGERSKRAIAIGAASVGRGGLLVIRQEYFEGLDPVAAKELAQEALDQGVVVLTAEATDGPLRAEVYGAVA